MPETGSKIRSGVFDAATAIDRFNNLLSGERAAIEFYDQLLRHSPARQQNFRTSAMTTWPPRMFWSPISGNWVERRLRFQRP